MPQRNAKLLTHRPKGLSDSVDGSNAFPGAMQLLANLIPDPATPGVWIARVAAFLKIRLGTNPTALLVVGDIAYGMVNSLTHPGLDEPFAYDLSAGAFLAISGVTAATLPTSPPATGDWTPPILKQVGSRIVATHPGFPGSLTGKAKDYGIKFGWLDVSGFTLATTGNFQTTVTFTGDTDTADANGANLIEGMPAIIGADGITLYLANSGNLVPVPIGALVTGTNIPANTTITAASIAKFTGNALGAFGTGDLNATTTIANLKDNSGAASTAGLYVGQQVAGNGIPSGATIATINRGAFSLTLSAAATITQSAVQLSITGTQIKLSKNVTGTGDGITFTTANANTITGNPPIAGISPGMSVAGSGVPANTVVVSTNTVTGNIVGTATAGKADFNTATTTAALAVGMPITGLGVPTGTTIKALAAFVITLSAPMLASGTVQLFWSATTITVNTTLTGPANGVQLTIAGGTKTAPQWGAGDTATNTLPSVPLGVGQMSGRAWFACGTDGIVFSDPLSPCVVSNTLGVQALVPGNGLPVTAIGELQLSALTGGIVQGLIAFQRDSQMLQITGDPTTANLTLNALPVATGTHAPLTICGTPQGLMFVSPAGLRIVDFGGQVSDPIGQNGAGVTLPFIQTINPPLTGPNPASRMCAACNGSIIRVSVPTSSGVAYEYWYDLGLKAWHGPHTCAAQLIQTWSDTFLLAPAPSIIPGQAGQIWQSDEIPNSASTYVENGAQLDWGYGTVLLPDNGMGAMNAMTEGALFLALVQGLSASVSFVNELGTVIDSVTIGGTSAAPGWGGFTWGGQIWGAHGPAPQERALSWNQPIVFKQGRLIATGPSDASVRIGNAYLRHQVLGYQLGNAV